MQARSKAQSEVSAVGQTAPALSISQQVAEVKRLSAEAVAAQEQEAYQKALESYTTITHKYPDLAITQYARIQRALLLYQLGQQQEAVLELQGQELELRGSSEVHAALAAMLYTEKPKQLDRAETQFEVAKEFDSRYTDLEWISKQKKWPPAMRTALQSFLDLT